MRYAMVALEKSVGIEGEPSGQSVPSWDLNFVFLECKTEAIGVSKI
jgi:hypothetical protein